MKRKILALICMVVIVTATCTTIVATGNEESLIPETDTAIESVETAVSSTGLYVIAGCAVVIFVGVAIYCKTNGRNK